MTWIDYYQQRKCQKKKKKFIVAIDNKKNEDDRKWLLAQILAAKEELGLKPPVGKLQNQINTLNNRLNNQGSNTHNIWYSNNT